MPWVEDLAGVHQALAFEAVHAQHATAGVGGVVLGGVQPFAALVDHRMAVEVRFGCEVTVCSRRPSRRSIR
jgi:hypothetical protein